MRLICPILYVLLFFLNPVDAATLKIGAARADITPPKSVPLWGQFNMRLSQGAETPLTVNVVALESLDGEKPIDNVIFVSADLLQISNDLFEAVRKQVAARDDSIDPDKLVTNGTHTHTAPTLLLDAPSLPKSDEIMDYPELIDFLASRIAEAVVEAWKSRRPGKMAYGLDFAVLGWSRRIVYADGHAEMYGKTNRPDFHGIENMEDHDVGMIFFWDENDRMLAAVLNIACPSQVVEGRSMINADFWHPVREKLAQRLGKETVVLGWCSAAADIAPRPMFRREAVGRMRSLRQLDEMQEIARKIDRAVAETLDVVRGTAVSDVTLKHRTATLQLPMRKVTEQEFAAAKAECDKIDAALKASPDKTLAEIAWMADGWHGDVVHRYETQQKDPDPRYPTTIHVIRLGDTAVFTNSFEMFTDYGIRMKSRSPAVQTFVVQLVGNGTYLPTEKAVHGGGYSAVIQSTPVGPEGGQMLVDETLKLAEELFQ